MYVSDTAFIWLAPIIYNVGLRNSSNSLNYIIIPKRNSPPARANLQHPFPQSNTRTSKITWNRIWNIQSLIDYQLQNYPCKLFSHQISLRGHTVLWRLIRRKKKNCSLKVGLHNGFISKRQMSDSIENVSFRRRLHWDAWKLERLHSRGPFFGKQRLL